MRNIIRYWFGLKPEWATWLLPGDKLKLPTGEFVIVDHSGIFSVTCYKPEEYAPRGYGGRGTPTEISHRALHRCKKV